ncbi:thiolase domain-containing protein [Iamia sp.]|uniref:thiolase domain-containing protein n=1 Tax=Iamia sp. TaxID=2722710 RepID=UPI002CE533CC|nr:thiolase domain-containing protein [Iamia sp.]HXH56056.1 thiolase domain-containing protein [Iamia sp.]
MRDVAVISVAQTPARRRVKEQNEVEMLMPAIHAALSQVDMTIDDIGFTCSGSTDYLAGVGFSFVSTLDGVGPWPPIQESHVEMDGAWALYEAWVKLQLGELDTALVYSYAKSSPGDLPMVLTRQLDPITVAPLWPDSVSLAALQARALIDAGKITEEQMCEVAVRSRRAALGNPNAQLAWDRPDAELLAEEHHIAPLRKSDCAPITDGAAAIVLAAGDAARDRVERPAWIRGIDHRVESIHLGHRDLTVSESTRIAAEKAGVADGTIDVAELHAPFSHQELILREALGLGPEVDVNPSGGALAANAMMTAGLIRIGEVANRISAGQAERGVAHATSGPCLQQNLVCVLEADPPRTGARSGRQDDPNARRNGAGGGD